MLAIFYYSWYDTVMFNKLSKFFNKRTGKYSENKAVVASSKKVATDYLKREKIEKGAKDFAKRFENVMRELANG